MNRQSFARQAIVTKYCGPTNTRGSRVSVRCDAKRALYHWDSELDVFENHRVAALKLAMSLGWLDDGSSLIGGALPGNAGYCFVIVPKGGWS